MENEYSCPLVGSDIDETMCYDIQMVVGPGNLINRRILEDYADVFDVSAVTDKRAAAFCPGCPFNQLRQAATGYKPDRVPSADIAVSFGPTSETTPTSY